MFTSFRGTDLSLVMGNVQGVLYYTLCMLSAIYAATGIHFDCKKL